ncbi:MULTISPECIES: hypothetical protein [Hungatella]|nr:MULTISPECIES: hypothetical protein [Hungatella]
MIATKRIPQQFRASSRLRPVTSLLRYYNFYLISMLCNRGIIR